jgi:cytochrome c
MGAPKVGDKDVWAPLIAEGVDVLDQNAIKGVGKMPPKGGNMKLSDDEVKAAVGYMVEKSK